MRSSADLAGHHDQELTTGKRLSVPLERRVEVVNFSL